MGKLRGSYFINQNYSTVTDCFSEGVLSNAYFTFDLTVRSPSLWVPPYSQYQYFLYETICNLQDDGLNNREIADWLNLNGYSTPRGKIFNNAHIHSIVKKKRVSDARLGKTYPKSITNHQLRYGKFPY